MQKKLRWNILFLILLIIIIAASATMAHLIERDFGNVEISIVKIMNAEGEIVAAKLFRPMIATAENPVPGIVNMHGYQNDKNVQDPYSIELAKRGFVVIAPDSLGHGDSGGGLNVGLWFADPTYTMGNGDALEFLAGLKFVDGSKIGITGHSMGGMTAVKMPGLYPENIKAMVQQATLPGSPALPNVLILQSRYDEFAGFRENQLRTEDLTSSESRLAALGVEGPVEWDTTYGSFDDGSARRMAFINMDHHLQPLTNKAVAEAVNWFNEALRDGEGGPMWSDPTDQSFFTKEIFGFVTLLGTLITMLPLTNILLQTKFFAPVGQPMPENYHAEKGKWWLFATINMLIGGILYPFTTSLGGIATKIKTWLPFMKMEMANGVAAFYIANAVVALILFIIWFSGKKKEGLNLYDMGVTFGEEKNKLDWVIIGKTILLGFILFMWMYLLEGFFQWALGQEFRFAWPYMRQFSSPERVGYFFLYLIPALLFWLINGGVFLFGQIRQKKLGSSVATQWVWWLKNLYAMVTGLFLVWCFQYLPWILNGPGPGFEALGLTQYSGMWPLMLIPYIPLFVVMIWFLTWFYRKTGKIYLGALMVAAITIWFMTAGTVIAM